VVFVGLGAYGLSMAPRAIPLVRGGLARVTVQQAVDAAAAALFTSAIRYAAVYRRVEWWDRREGNMPNPDVRYPQLSKPAAFICTDSTCSLPIFDASKIATEVARSVQPLAKN